MKRKEKPMKDRTGKNFNKRNTWACESKTKNSLLVFGINAPEIHVYNLS
jgi:hypothetical protein